MTVTVNNQKIPLSHFQTFHELLCHCGGRYLANPRQVDDHVRVSYTVEDYPGMSAGWLRVTTVIREVRRNQRWRVILRRLGFSF